MARILSLQSHVAYGYVGNRAAVFPLQRLGNEVIIINSVQFSNHTGYGKWTGDVMSVEHIEQIFLGLEQRGVLNNLDAVLTGYMGSSELGQVLIKWIAKIRKLNPQLIYCCDPVMGDLHSGCFVRPGIPEFFKQQAVPIADIITPNQFELNYLAGDQNTKLTDCGRKLNNLEEVIAACQKLHLMGNKLILVTSLERANGNPEQIEMLISSPERAYLVATPKLDLAHPMHGGGDVVSALFLAKYLETNDIEYTLSFVAGAVFDLFKLTQQTNAHELAIIAAQDFLVKPSQLFPVTQVKF